MEALAQMKKIAAKKTHYDAIASMLDIQLEEMKKTSQAAMRMVRNEGRDGESEKFKEIHKSAMRAMAMDLMAAMTPVYAIAFSLQQYKQAFGEYPEWTKFMSFEVNGKTGTEGVDEFVVTVINHFLHIEELGSGGKHAHEIAFGDMFKKKSDSIKIKGEV